MTDPSTAIGLDIGGTKIAAVLVDRDDPAIVLRSHRRDTPSTPDGVLDAIVETIEALGGAATIGIGLPGLVDRSGILRSAPNLPVMVDVDVIGPIARRTDAAVAVDNDATCALRAEMAIGAAAGFGDVVLVTLGTGIGGAIAIGGSLVRGTNGFAGEPGHMCVDPTGPVCVCGRRGCWERYASGSGIAHAASIAGMAVPSTRGAEAVVAAARAGDPTAIGVLDGFAEWLGVGIADLADLLDPELVVIGGGLVEMADLFLERAREVFDRHVLGGSVLRRTSIVPTALGADSGAVGAALLH